MNASRVETGTWSKAPAGSTSASASTRCRRAHCRRQRHGGAEAVSHQHEPRRARASRPPAARRRRSHPAPTRRRRPAPMRRARGGRAQRRGGSSAAPSSVDVQNDSRPPRLWTSRHAGSPVPPSSTAMRTGASLHLDHASTSREPRQQQPASSPRERERRKQSQDLGISRRAGEDAALEQGPLHRLGRAAQPKAEQQAMTLHRRNAKRERAFAQLLANACGVAGEVIALDHVQRRERLRRTPVARRRRCCRGRRR